MSKEKKELLNVTIKIEAVTNAARNADSLDNLALEIDTISPKDLHLDMKVFTLKAVPVNDKLKGKRKELAPKTVGIRSFTVDSLSNQGKEGYITINGTMDIPKTGSKVVKLEECIFATEDDARAVARAIVEVELEKALNLFDEAQDTMNALKAQIEDDRF